MSFANKEDSRKSLDANFEGLSTSSLRHRVSIVSKSHTWAYRIIHSLDAYKLETRPPSICGGLVTLSILPITIAYCIILLLGLFSAPKLARNNVIWSIYESPFPMMIRCEVAGGCLVSNFNGTAGGACTSLDYQANMTLQVDFFQNPLYGVSVIAALPDPLATIASIMSQTYMPARAGADGDGTFIMWGEVLGGTTLVNMVVTTNYTLQGSGRRRREWFGVLVSYSGAPLPGSSPCLPLLPPPPAGLTHQQARVRLQPSFNEITVTDPASPTEVFGTCSGFYAALMSWGSVLVRVAEHLG